MIALNLKVCNFTLLVQLLTLLSNHSLVLDLSSPSLVAKNLLLFEWTGSGTLDLKVNFRVCHSSNRDWFWIYLLVRLLHRGSSICTCEGRSSVCNRWWSSHQRSQGARIRTQIYRCLGSKRISVRNRWIWRGNWKRAHWFWFYLRSRFWCQNRTRILYSLDSCWSRIYLLVRLLHRVCNICTCEEEGTLWILWCCYGYSLHCSIRHNRDYPPAAQRITQDLRSSQAHWFWFYLRSRFWCQNRSRILHPIHSTWRRKYLVDLVVLQKHLVQIHQTTLLSSHLRVRSILLCSPSPSRSLSRQDSSQTRHSPPSNSELPRLVCNLSKFMANWTSPSLLLQKLQLDLSWILQHHGSIGLQSNRQDHPLLLRGQCCRERDQFHGRVWISLRICIRDRSNCGRRREAGTVLLRWQSSRAYCSCSTCYNWWTLWILQHNRSEGLRLSRTHYTLQVTGTAIESASIAEEGTATPGLDVNGNLVERATFAHAGTGSIFGFSSTTEARVIVPRGLRNIFTVVGNVEESETNVEIGSGTLSGFVGGAESTSNAEVKFTLFTIGGDTVGGDVKFTAANLAVGQVRIGLSNDGIPGDISRGITVFRLRTFPEGPKVRFTGTKAESFTPAPHIAEGLIDIEKGTKDTKSRYIEYRDPQPTRIVVI